MTKTLNVINNGLTNLARFRFFIFVLLAPLSLFGQQDSINSIQLIRVPQSWTDSTRTDQLILTIQSNQTIDTLLVSGRSKLGQEQVFYSIPLNSDKIFSSYKSLITLNEHDSLVVTSLNETAAKLFYYKVPIYRFANYSMSVPVSMFTFRTGEQLNRIPSNHFSKTDTVVFEFAVRLPDTIHNDRYGYQLLIQSSLADTVVHSYKHVQEGGFTTITGQVPAAKFGSGRYFIQANLFKNNVKVASVSSLPLYVLLSPSDTIITERQKTPISISSSLFASYSDNELNLLFDQAQYIALPEELTLYRRLTNLSQKQAFMETFWSNRSQDPNNNLISYTEKISHVNRVYRGGGKEGYLTDRGKVYLKYGPCDDVFVSTSDVNVKPYEVWYYPELKGQSSVYFYFVDTTGYGNYQLVHSTARDEVYNLQYLLRLGIDPTSYREQ